MRLLFGLMCVLALGTSCIVGCGEDRIPCERHEDCPPLDDPGVCYLRPLCKQGGYCEYSSDRVGAGCALSDGRMGVCNHEGCTRESGPISCKHGYNDCCNWEDGALCRSQDLREGTCLDGVCGGEHFCEGVVSDEPDNLCESDQFCNWEGVCEFRQVTDCWKGTCTFHECDPDVGCVYTNRPNGADCPLDWVCCFLTAGYGECCRDGTCADGICVPK